MNAIKFMTEYQRMCTSYDRCADCPLYADRPCAEIPSRYTKEFSAKLIKGVEDWSAAHPIATRQDIFKKIYPNATIDQDGVSVICPKHLDKGFNCVNPIDCPTCRQKYWLKEVQE